MKKTNIKMESGSKQHHMKKCDVENELSSLLGTTIKIQSNIQPGIATASIVVGKWEFTGEAKSIDYAYRALLMRVREEINKGFLRRES